jgi:alpha-D-xyloside xylohydrolase
MRFLKNSLGIALLLISMIGKAQNFEKTELGVKATINSVETELQFYSPTILRVIKYPTGKEFSKQSLSVVQVPEKTAFSIKNTGNTILLDSKSLQVSLNLSNGEISFSNNGKKLLREKNSGASFIDFDDAGSKTYTVSQSFELDTDEPIYGLGQQQQGKMSNRGVTLNMVQGNTDDYIPFFQSAKGYGLFWDNYSPTIFKDSVDGTSFKSDVGDGIDYYFMYGGNVCVN